MNLSLSSRSFRRFALVAVLCAAAPSFAQSRTGEAAPQSEGAPPSAAIHAGTFGMTGGLFTGGSTSVGFLYFLGNTSALHIDFATALIFTPASFDFDLGLAYRMYLAQVDKISLFVEPGIRVGFDATTNFNFSAGAGVGLEYFLADRLSIGAIASLSLVTTNRFANVGISTATSALFLNFYF